jgi:hypothetical protein
VTLNIYCFFRLCLSQLKKDVNKKKMIGNIKLKIMLRMMDKIKKFEIQKYVCFVNFRKKVTEGKKYKPIKY